MRIRWCAVIAVVCLCAHGVEAASLRGVVNDQTGLPLPGVIVEARQGDRLLALAESRRDGGYELVNLPEQGEVELRWALVQFATAARRLRLPHAGRIETTLTLALHADVVVTSDRSFRNLADLGEGARDLVGVADAASQGIVPSRLLANRALARAGDILEAVPGLLVTQHSGEGKANQ